MGGRARRGPSARAQQPRGCLVKLLLTAVLVGGLLIPASPASGRPDCSRACIERVKHRQLTHARRERARREAREWRRYRNDPMPWCTWGPESGGDWTARNPSSSAGGRYQIIASTWYAMGGPATWDSRWPAAAARPLIQERIARRVLHRQGLHAWVRC